MAAMRLTMAALVLCAAFATPAYAGRQLKQSSGTIKFPGCTFFSDSEIANNKDFSDLYAALQATGLNDTLSNLSGPATLFAPTNSAFVDFLAAANLTVEQALASPTTKLVLLSHIVPGAIMSESKFVDGEVLATLLPGSNLTTLVDEANTTEVVTVVSFAAEATVVTPAAYACNLVIYGIDGVLLPEVALFPFEADTLMEYLTGTLRPGFAEVPLSLIVAAVQGDETEAVAEAFLTAISNYYLQQLVALYEAAAGNQEAQLALAAVGNQAILDNGCAAYTPLLQQLPSSAALRVAASTQKMIAQSYPAYAKCVSESS
ncbi:hypothetical protein ABBQ38_008927 [Trebouxia sp. C0009 RCD-2024]